MSLDILRKKALRKAKEKVKKEKFKRDKLVIQTIDTIDELDEISNLMTERVRNWYSLHYPELSKLIRNTESYLAIVSELKHRRNMKVKNLKKYTDRAERIVEIAEQTMGADISEKDMNHVARLATLAIHAKQERNELAQYVEDLIKEIAPNMYSLAGGMLTARLIALAGSFERLAEFPASTVQVLGAETALFSHLKTGTDPPKHGVIFAFPAIRRAKKHQRGKLSRAVANKLAIAAKMDYFGHGDDGGKLKKELDAKIEGILARTKKK